MQPVTNPPLTPEAIEKWWKAGNTLPLETTAKYPLEPINIPNDTGINVLVDMAHKCDFFLLWTLGDQLHERGLRSAGSHATLDSLLTPGSPCRIRIPVAPKVHPFAWWPAPKWNVVLSEGAVQNPAYIPKERQALKKYLADGGGFIVSGSTVKGEEASAWSLNQLLAEYGAKILPGEERYEGRKWPAMKVDDEWEIVLKGDGGKPIYARRTYEKGRIVLFASSGLFHFNKKDKDDVAKKSDFLAETIKWAAAGSTPAGGEPRIPTPMWGGGGIYQESEERLDGIVCYYSKNQTPELLKTVREDFPAITEDIYTWLPSPKPEQPMYLILCSGGGGGWAVNAYQPKEASTISTSPDGIRSIFAHEQAHTMSGPCTAANHAFGGNQGEPHAGWFQGKINAKYNGVKGPNRGCNSVFREDADVASGEPEKIFNEKELEKWTGKEWTYGMIWYAWQKLDDRYGPTWYPRWRWVQSQRWTHDPDRELTWEESIEDMSIAVGEDLFPFFIATGKKLEKARFPSATFLGETIEFPVAPIKLTPPGDVRLGVIGDYTKPLAPAPVE